MVDIRKELAKLREDLSKKSAQYWKEYSVSIADQLLAHGSEDFARQPSQFKGQLLRFNNVDITNQVLVDNREAILIEDDAGQLWAIACGTRYKDMLGLAEEVQLTFGWPRCRMMDAVVRLGSTGVWYDDSSGIRHERHVPKLALETVRLHEQFVVFQPPDDPAQIPGLESARERKAKLAKPGAKKAKLTDPKDVISALKHALDLADLTLFSELWMKAAQPMARRRFQVYLDYYRACDRKISFERYDEHNSPENYKKTGVVRLFVRRDNTDGTTKSSPLLLIQEANVWRLKSGAI